MRPFERGDVESSSGARVARERRVGGLIGPRLRGSFIFAGRACREKKGENREKSASRRAARRQETLVASHRSR